MIHHHNPPCNVDYVNNFPFDKTTISTAGENSKLSGHFAVSKTAASRGLGRTTLLGGSTRW